MSQEIRIPVEVQTGPAERGLQGIDTAAGGAADSISGIATAAREAATAVDTLEANSRRLAAVQQILSREFNRPVSQTDAQTAINNFDRLKNSRDTRNRGGVRQFDDLEQWYMGHRGLYRNPAAADQQKRAVLSSVMQHTDDVRENGTPPPADDGGQGGGGGGQGGGLGSSPGARRAASAGMSLLKGGLALAGVTSVGAMVTAGVNSAGDEAVDTDTMKRRMGDLGVDFDILRDRVRASGEGLGITFTELAKRGSQYASVAGNLTAKDDVGGSLRTSGGFARGYGIDPSQADSFFATMRRMQGDGGDTRKLSYQIADAIEKGGYGGKADEVLAAIADYTTIAARATLSTSNVAGYSGAMAGLMATGLPGLDPQGSASLLSQADSSFRRGGGKGEASRNAFFMSIMGGHKGLDAFDAQAMQEGGLFATTRSTFGPRSALEGWGDGKLDDTTNLELVQKMIRRQYGGGKEGVAAMSGALGVTLGQGSELLNLSTADLSASQQLAKEAGVKGTNPTAIAGIAKIAAANKEQLQPIFEAMMARPELRKEDRARLSGALDTGDMDEVKRALAVMTDKYGQESTEGDKTRQTITDVKNAITALGTALLGPLNVIRDAISAVAKFTVPGYAAGIENGKINAQNAGKDYASIYRARGTSESARLDERLIQDRYKYDQMKRKANGGPVDLSKIVAPDSLGTNDPAYERDMARRQALERLENPTSGGASRATLDYTAKFNALKDKQKTSVRSTSDYLMRRLKLSREQTAGLVGNLFHESHGLDPEAVNKGDAKDGSDSFGIAQWNMERLTALKRFAVARKGNYRSIDIQRQFVAHEMETTKKDALADLRSQSTVTGASESVRKNYEVGKDPIPRVDASNMVYQQIPGAVASEPDRSSRQQVEVRVPDVRVVHENGDGTHRGTISMKPTVTARAAGTRPEGIYN